MNEILQKKQDEIRDRPFCEHVRLTLFPGDRERMIKTLRWMVKLYRKDAPTSEECYFMQRMLGAFENAAVLDELLPFE